MFGKKRGGIQFEEVGGGGGGGCLQLCSVFVELHKTQNQQMETREAFGWYTLQG